MVKIKTGVTPHNLVILAAIANICGDYPHDIVITSGTDSTHKVGSRHYTGDALDIRTSNFLSPAARNSFMSKLRARLGKDYQVLLESDHIHVEWDVV